MSRSPETTGKTRAALTLAALGIVFGDIGTSPLYAVKLLFHPMHGVPVSENNILGGISAIFWALTLVVTIKYVILILRADNHGEGGILALTALALSSVRGHSLRRQRYIALAGLCGGSLFFAEAVITPAISVLSAVEGLEIGVPALHSFILPIAVCILLGLFALQRFGTAAVGVLFGPIAGLWFLSLIASGASAIAQNPVILSAINPIHALGFIFGHGFLSFVILGSVLLVFTGAEALYADMGHFGRGPIRLAWGGLVFPALVLNYMGQGALLLSDPSAVDNPFYRLFPGWALYPMVVLATAATVIASQACISGIFSLANQAIQFGYLPRMEVLHTSSRLAGQIFMPGINRLLLFLVLAAAVGFASSENLAAAYGLSVSGAMLATTFIATFVYRYHWHYPLAICIAGAAFFGCIDLAFVSSSLLKVTHGGWFPLLLASIVIVVMLSWRDGKKFLYAQLRQDAVPLESFLMSLFRQPPVRVPGMAVFLTARQNAVPHALLHNLKHNKVIHEQMLFLTVSIAEHPRVAASERHRLSTLGHGCYRLILVYGFMEHPDIAQALRELGEQRELHVDPEQASFFLSRESVIPSKVVESGMAFWREQLFTGMVRNAGSAVDYFRIPPNRVIELGTQIEI